jgi:choline dehydrogenase-like flavoprotein
LPALASEEMAATAVQTAVLDKVYLDAPHVSVRCEGQRVVVEWRVWANSADRRRAQETSLRAAEVSRATQLLVDARDMRLVLVDDERWWSEVMLPRLTTTEIRWIAVVVPANQLAEVSVGEMAKTRRRDGAESRHFRTIDEARAWLSSKGTPIR